METQNIIKQERDIETTKVIKFLKTQVKLFKEDFSKADFYNITLIHIIYNRLRRGTRRPHLISSEEELSYLKKYEYQFNSINSILKKKEMKEVSFENVYNVK